jgi:hypothetical protein
MLRVDRDIDRAKLCQDEKVRLTLCMRLDERTVPAGGVWYRTMEMEGRRTGAAIGPRLHEQRLVLAVHQLDELVVVRQI